MIQTAIEQLFEGKFESQPLSGGLRGNHPELKRRNLETDTHKEKRALRNISFGRQWN